MENVIVGNGSTEIIHLLTRAYIGSPPSGCSPSALLLTPTYGEYDGAVRISGGEVLTLTATRPMAGSPGTSPPPSPKSTHGGQRWYSCATRTTHGGAADC